MTDQAVEPTATGRRPHPFTGRDRELGALREDIERVGLHTLSGRPLPHCRILLIAGTPGSGRTSLAEEFVRRIADRYPRGLLRARLTDPGGTPVPTERTARDLLAGLARLDTRDTRGRAAPRPRDIRLPPAPPPGADEAAVAEAFRTALTRRGRTVLLLDDVADTDQLLDLVPESRDCLVVAVSTGPLTGVPDVRPCALGGLDRASAVALLARYAGSSPRVTVDPRSAEVLAEQCGGLPAALLLVGRWLAARPKLSLLEASRALADHSEPAPPPSGGPDVAGERAVPGDGAGEASAAAELRDVPARGEGGADAGPPSFPTDGEPAAPRGNPAARTAPTAPGTPAAPACAALDDHGLPREQATGPGAVAPGPLTRAFRLVYGSLSRPSARLLRLLSLAPAGFVDPQTASALGGCSVSTACLALDEFARAGLLRELGADRYQVPGCLDSLLRAELTAEGRPGEVLLARARLLERLVRRLQACRDVCEPAGSPGRRRLADMPRGLRFSHPGEARAWLEARRPALLAAAGMAVAQGGGRLDTLARRLVSALARAFEAHRTPEEAAPELYRLHELMLRVAERARLHRERAAALLHLGDLDARADRFEEALVRYRAALDAARDGDDAWAAGRAMDALGGSYAELDDWERAADWYGRALALRLTRDEHADREAAARLHGRLGTVHAHAGRWDEALRAWRASASAFRRLHDPGAQALALAEAARVQERAGRQHEALRSCEQALTAARGAGDPALEAGLERRAAEVCERLGNLRAARAHRTAAARLLGDPAPAGPRPPAAPTARAPVPAPAPAPDGEEPRPGTGVPGEADGPDGVPTGGPAEPVSQDADGASSDGP